MFFISIRLLRIPTARRSLCFVLAGLCAGSLSAKVHAQSCGDKLAVATSCRGDKLVVIRDAETGTPLRGSALPLRRAPGIPDALVRIVLLRNAAINSFSSPGNRLFINAGSTPDRLGREPRETSPGPISRAPGKPW